MSLEFATTVNSQFKKDLNLQTHLHKTLFSDDQFLESVHKSFFNQTTLNLGKEKGGYLNRELTYYLPITNSYVGSAGLIFCNQKKKL